MYLFGQPYHWIVKKAQTKNQSDEKLPVYHARKLLKSNGISGCLVTQIKKIYLPSIVQFESFLLTPSNSRTNLVTLILQHDFQLNSATQDVTPTYKGTVVREIIQQELSFKFSPNSQKNKK